MAPASTIEPAQPPRASLGRYAAIVASLALHSVLLYAASRAPAPTPASSSPPIMWLEARAVPPPKVAETPEPPPDPAEIEEAPPPEPTPEPEPPLSTEPVTEAEAPRAAESSAPEPPGPAQAPRDPAPASTTPRIDWNKERRKAITSVIEDRERAGNYRTFSLDDVEEPKLQTIEPAPKPMVTDNCVIATNRFARMAAMMIGRCVREPNGDLFAAAKPAYLDRKPVCRETRPESPGSVTSDGRVLSTVKCELVAEDELDDLPLDVPQ